MSELALSEGWVSSSIGNVNIYKSKNIKPFDFSDTVFELYSVPVFFSGYPEILKGKEIGSSKSVVEKDDVLICKINPRINRVWIVKDYTEHRNIASSEWIVFRQSLLDPKFMKYYYQSLGFREKLCADVSGVGGSLTRAKPREVANYLLPIASIAEQNKISHLLDEYLTTVSQIQARLDAIPKLIEKFRQSVLSDAVSGELCNNQNVNSSIVSELCEFQNGFAFKSGWFLKQGKFQVIKLGNIRENRLAIENSPAFLDENIGKDHSKFCANKKDILISMTGTRFKRDYGFSCLVTESDKFLINQRVGRFIVNEEKIIHKYLLLILRSNGFRNDFFEGETGGVNQGNVGSTHIKNISISYPDILTQEKIVDKTEVLFSFANQIEKSVATAKARVDYLTQSILHQAFTGNLTAEWREQNPELITGDNSAKTLLAKIKAEKQGNGKKKSSKG